MAETLDGSHYIEKIYKQYIQYNTYNIEKKYKLSRVHTWYNDQAIQGGGLSP